MNFGVVDNFPYPPFVTHSTLTSGKKEKSSTPSFLPVPVASASVRPFLPSRPRFDFEISEEVFCTLSCAIRGDARDWLI